MLTVEHVENGAVTLLRLDGEIDDEGNNVLRLALMDCIRAQRHHVVLNLAKVKFVSYAGVGVFFERLGQLRACRGDLKLAGMNLQGRRLLDTMGLSRVIECYDSESAALLGCQKEAA